MFYKYVTSVYGWINTGITAYGTRPADTNGVRWVEWFTHPDESPTFPNDDRRPNIGPPKMMRCG
jgi:hypothetical protein